MKPKHKILIVEDEKKIAEAVSKGLSEHCYSVDIAKDGMEGKKLSGSTFYDLILLDINLPFINGIDLCRHIKANQPKAFVILISAIDAAHNQKIDLYAGADAYFAKPFDFNELLLCIQTLLNCGEKLGNIDQTIKVSNLTMDLDGKKVTRGDKQIILTSMEFQLLEYLIKNKNKIVSGADIAAELWDLDLDAKTNAIDVYISLLKRKIDQGFSSKLIYSLVDMEYVLKEEA
ncbi:MAG: response regulator transcription factor [Bacteroidetes bacterium]|nr:response regulator transcription factor [Bacteroidota bacterium]